MARSRMLRPDFFNDPQFSQLTVGARYLYLALIPHMDRHGIMLADPRTLRATCLPFDHKMRISQVRRWLVELQKQGRVVLFKYLGQEYLVDPGFALHQRIYSNDPDTYKIPVETLLEVIRNFVSTQSGQSSHYLIQYQYLYLKDKPEEKTQAGKGGDDAPNNASPPSEPDDDVIKAQQKLIETRRAQGLNDDGSVKLPGYPPAAAGHDPQEPVKKTLLKSEGTQHAGPFCLISPDGTVKSPIFMNALEFIAHCKKEGLMFHESAIKKVGNYYAVTVSDKI